MAHKLAVDFGTTNSVIARWDEAAGAAEIVALPAISTRSAEHPPIVPSLLYIHSADDETVTIGQTVRDEGLDGRQDNRLFRNFKRGVVSSPTPPRYIDGRELADRDAGRLYLRRMLAALPYPMEDIEQLVLTAPVASFEGYLDWLEESIPDIPADKIRILDESTAAALGYAVTKPGAVVLVFDFGGGTLDLSLVQLPEHREKAGGFLKKLIGGGAGQSTARVIAKAGRVIGGSDIDQWLLALVLERVGLTTEQLGGNYPRLLTLCEQAKILLSTETCASVRFDAAGRSHESSISREEMEGLLEQNGFYDALRRVVDKVMHVARQRGIFREDIHHVLMVGGTSLMPSVQRTLAQYFTDMAVRADKPFTAVAEGALKLAAEMGLEDHLIHSYGLRHYNPATGAHDWDEIVPMGSGYPLPQPVEVILGAAHPGQQEIEFIIGEIDTDTVAMVEVRYENGQAVFVARAGESEQKIVVLNEKQAPEILARLSPVGQPGEDRLRALFSIDTRRRLRLTVVDLASGAELLQDVVVATLR